MTTIPALLVTRDDALRDDVLRLAAAAGAPLADTREVDVAARSWGASTLVLVGADLAPVVAARQLPGQREVHVLCDGPAPDGLYRHALAMAARGVVELPAGEPWLAELLADTADGTTRIATTVGVVPGSGGAGASTFAAALAQVGSRGGDVTLLDLDPWGPGSDRLLGLDDAEGVRWQQLADLDGRLGSRALRDALPAADRLGVLTWAGRHPPDPVSTRAVTEVVSAAGRGSDLVVVDLPRSLDGAAADVVPRCDLAVLVVLGTLSGVAAAGRVAGLLGRTGVDVGVVVRRTRRALPADTVAATLGLPLLAELPTRRRVAELVDLGLGPAGSRRSPLTRAAGAVLDAARGESRWLP